MLKGIRFNKGLLATAGLGLCFYLMAPLLGQEEEKPENESQYTLPEVIVTATRVNQPLKEVPLSSSVITREALETTPALDVGDILRTQTGVYVRSTNLGGVATASLRGAQSSQVLVVRDGMPINDAFLGLTDLSRLMLGGVERIEIVRGPTSHLYGANALGGVINLITREPEPVRNLTAAYGSFNTQQLHLHAGQGDSEKGAIVSAAVNKSDGWRGNDDFRHRSVLCKLNYTVGKVLVSVSTGYDDSEVGVPGPKPDSAVTPIYGNNEVTSLFDRQKADNFYGLLAIKSTLGDNYTMQLRLRPQRSITDFKKKWLTGETILGHDQYTLKNLRLSGQVDKQMDTNHLLAGFDVINERGFVEQTTTIEATAEDSTTTWNPSTRSSALWTEYIWHKRNASVVLGIRSDYHSVYGWHTSPSLGIILQLGANTVRLSAGEAYRAPSFNDLFWPDDGLFSGNPDLKSETGTAYEIGLVHRISQTIRGSVAVFRRDVDDMIAWAPTSEGKWQPANVNRFSVNGLEAEVNVQLETLHARVGYTLLDAVQIDLDVERPAAFIPSETVSAEIHAGIAGFDLVVRGEYRSGIRNYYGDSEKLLPARTVIDTRLSKTLWELEPYVEVRNILDTKYSDQFGFTEFDRDYPLPGRTFGIGLRMKF
ncbi:Vitamin B12 transporter BtuB [subsurface metagenome]